MKANVIAYRLLENLPNNPTPSIYRWNIIASKLDKLTLSTTVWYKLNRNPSN